MLTLRKSLDAPADSEAWKMGSEILARGGRHTEALRPQGIKQHASSPEKYPGIHLLNAKPLWPRPT